MDPGVLQVEVVLREGAVPPVEEDREAVQAAVRVPVRVPVRAGLEGLRVLRGGKWGMRRNRG